MSQLKFKTNRFKLRFIGEYYEGDYERQGGYQGGEIYKETTQYWRGEVELIDLTKPEFRHVFNFIGVVFNHRYHGNIKCIGRNLEEEIFDLCKGELSEKKHIVENHKEYIDSMCEEMMKFLKEEYKDENKIIPRFYFGHRHPVILARIVPGVLKKETGEIILEM